MEGNLPTSKLQLMGSGDWKPFKNTKGKSTRKVSKGLDKHAGDNSTRSPLVVLKRKSHNMQKNIQHAFCLSRPQALSDDEKDDLLDRNYENRHSDISAELDPIQVSLDSTVESDLESNAEEDTLSDLYWPLNFSQVKYDEYVDDDYDEELGFIPSSSSLRFSEVAAYKETKTQNLFRFEEIEDGNRSIDPELPPAYDVIKDNEWEETSKTVTKHKSMMSSYDSYEYLRATIPLVSIFLAYFLVFVLFYLT